MPVRNKLTDLNTHLFDCLERLMDAEDGDELNVEVKRAKAVSSVAANIIANADLSLRAVQYTNEVDACSQFEITATRKIPEVLRLNDGKEDK